MENQSTSLKLLDMQDLSSLRLERLMDQLMLLPFNFKKVLYPQMFLKVTMIAQSTSQERKSLHTSNNKTSKIMLTYQTSLLVIHHKRSEHCSILDQLMHGFSTRRLHLLKESRKNSATMKPNHLPIRRPNKELTLLLVQDLSWATSSLMT